MDLLISILDKVKSQEKRIRALEKAVKCMESCTAQAGCKCKLEKPEDNIAFGE